MLIHKTRIGHRPVSNSEVSNFGKVKEIKELHGGVQVVLRTSDSEDRHRDSGKGPFPDGHGVVFGGFLLILGRSTGSGRDARRDQARFDHRLAASQLTR